MFSVTLPTYEYLLCTTTNGGIIPTVYRVYVGVYRTTAVVTLNVIDIVWTLFLGKEIQLNFTEGLDISHDISCTHNIISLWYALRAS
jgi:hypothetical protein